MTAFFEDIRLGSQVNLGRETFTADDIIRFATAYDPQPFHVDEAAAAASFYGGLIASGWHTAAVAMRLWVKHLQAENDASVTAPGERQPQAGPSPGVKSIRWLRPVRAGDTIRYSGRVIDKVDLSSRPRWGLVRQRFSGRNQNDDEVINFIGQSFTERRTAPR